ncbi:MAG TPA: calcium-binding protein [Rhizomicrobium sp.]|nr:calcium-binding protein [Rhizomicrobium sp.]
MSVITGTSGNDSGGIYNDSASSGADLFFMGQGGNDTVVSGSGDDVFLYDAALTSADSINGGAGYDTLSLNGDYSGAKAVIFSAATIQNIEEIDLAGGHSYQLTTNAASVANSFELKVDGSLLGANDSLIFNASASQNSYFDIIGGAGNDTLTTGAQTDYFDLSAGGNDHVNGGAGKNTYDFGAQFTAADSIAGSGTNIVALNGDYSGGVSFLSPNISNLSEVDLSPGHSYSLTFGSGVIASVFTTVKIDASYLGSSDVVTVNATAQDVSSFDYKFGGNFKAADHLSGTGLDTLELNGNYASGLTLASATIRGIEFLNLDGGHDYNIATNDKNVAAGKTLHVQQNSFFASDHLTFNGSAETDGSFYFTSSPGFLNLTGGALGDYFALGASTPGNVVANGGAGNDTFDFNGPSSAFSANDKLNGGAGTDTLAINATNGADYTLSATTLKSIENIVLDNQECGLSLDNGNVAAGHTLTIDASALTAANGFYFYGDQVTSGNLIVTGGAGNDEMKGGAGADQFNIGKGGADTINGGAGNDTFTSGAGLDGTDRLNGGAGNDTLVIDQPYPNGFTIAGSVLRSIENIRFSGQHNFVLELSDGDIAAGKTMTVSGAGVNALHQIDFYAGFETNGHVAVTGGAGADSLSGGALNDTINGGAGNDVLFGYGGADHLNGGAGHDIFYYGDAAYSTSTHYDTITGMNFDKMDTIALNIHPKGVDKAISTGTLRAAHFDSDLTAALGNHLTNHHAMLFTASAGTDKGEVFLVIDMNGHAGYQAGQDLVIHLDHAAHLADMDASDFIYSS